MKIRIRSKKIVAASIVLILGTWVGGNMLKKSPEVEPNFGVSSPSTRGFGTACDSSDFAQVPILKFGKRTWNKGARLPMEAVNRTIARKDIWTPSTFNGTYNCRVIRGGSSYSHHAWALALDVDAAKNSLGTSPVNCEINRDKKWTRKFIATFKQFGFYWGGDFGSRPDCMHFEYDGPALPYYKTRFPDGPDAHNKLAKALRAIGLKAKLDGRYTGLEEFASVLAFQKKNGLLKIDGGGQVRAPTWTLLLLAGKEHR